MGRITSARHFKIGDQNYFELTDLICEALVWAGPIVSKELTLQLQKMEKKDESNFSEVIKAMKTEIGTFE